MATCSGSGVGPLTLAWLCQQLTETSSLPQGSCVGSEEWVSQSPAPEQERDVIGKGLSAWTRV